MPPAEKVYLVVRADLPPGQQAVQAAHALQELNVHHGELVRGWYARSNTLAFLATKDELSLEKLHTKAQEHGFTCVQFREPDRDKELTALALGPEAARMVRHLPLALKERPP